MLEAVLESDEEMPSKKSASQRKAIKAEDELINGLESEDRATVQKIVDTTKSRLKALKRKIEAQRAAKRNSLPPGPARTMSGRSSPSATSTVASSTPPK
ncbi:hypothetical protein LTS18_007676 [Coniosporium uncinatum]|uniref:Uncharacterized protein n=1 Tax=Coniosporium uncinatum TaxID=93489 RepID=A0ACC3D2D0_9PEZI|nr:hypothetical protein LTS18_007676 [Coniosporium uncinatum]